MGRHGFMAEYYVESPQWLNKIPKNIADIGVLLEPMSVVEKGIDHAFLLQRRLEWKPKTGLVLGGGPIGLLAAAVCARAASTRTWSGASPKRIAAHSSRRRWAPSTTPSPTRRCST